MTREEKQKAIDALKISAPIMAVTQEKFTDYIQTLNKIMDWLEQVPCEDAISRQAAIDLIADFELSMGQVVRGIHALPSVTPKKETEWIPVSERLPEKNDLYLGYSDDGVYELVHCFNGIFSYSGVIAWMPLPEPYTAERRTHE